MLARDDMPPGLTPQLIARVQSTSGKSWGFVTETGDCLACMGLMETGPGALEAWFACRPELAGQLLDFVRLAQLTLALARHDATVTARVQPGWRPGERLARLTGFRPGEAPGVWMWSGP
jgi:hypothetical protein